MHAFFFMQKVPTFTRWAMLLPKDFVFLGTENTCKMTEEAMDWIISQLNELTSAFLGAGNT